jgi:hypothetical protein
VQKTGILDPEENLYKSLKGSFNVISLVFKKNIMYLYILDVLTFAVNLQYNLHHVCKYQTESDAQKKRDPGILDPEEHF